MGCKGEMIRRRMLIKEVAAQLHDEGRLTVKNLETETGLSYEEIKYVTMGMKRNGEWDYKIVRERLHIGIPARQKQMYENGIRKKVLDVIAATPHLSTSELRNMFANENLSYRSLGQYIYLARKSLGVRSDWGDHGKMNAIIESAHKHVRGDGSVYLRDIARDLNTSKTTVSRHVRRLKEKNAWPFKIATKYPNEERSKIVALMRENPWIGCKAVCETFGLDYASNRARITQLMYNIRRVEKVGLTRSYRRSAKLTRD